MKHRSMALVLPLLLLLATLAPTPGTQAQPNPNGDRFFPETGFTVPGRFMSYWNSHGGLAIFGYPITAPLLENGYLTQYFERNRFEYHPENAGTPYEVLLGLLGNKLTESRTFEPGQPFTNTADKVYFPETKHGLGGAFYQYWKNHGGLAQFGYPISEEIQERNATDGKTYTTQYFERNRFEAHPENADAQYQVLLGLLGQDYLKRFGTTGIAQPLPGTAGAPFPGWSATPPAGYPAAPGGPFLKGPQAGLGVIVDMYYKDRKRILDQIQDVGFTWVKQQIQWKDIGAYPGGNAWAELDHIVADTSARGINLMISVVKPPAWANGGGDGFPKDPQTLGDFMRAMAEHYKGRVKAYEIWNEQNLYAESHDLDPAHYAQLLKASYLGVKAGDPAAVVISGALTPTGIYDDNVAKEDTWYLDQLYQWNNGELRKYYDVLGSHPYGYNNAPETMWPDNPSQASGFTNHGQFYFRRIEQQRAIMEKYGEGGKQVWLTEYGWCSDKRDGGFNLCAENSLDDQATYTVRAIQRSRALYPWMGVMFLWNLNFSTFQDWFTGPAHFSLLNPDGSPRPVYAALKGLTKR